MAEKMVETVATVVKKDTMAVVKHAKMQKTTTAFAQLASRLANTMLSMRWSLNMVHTFANVVKKETNHARV